tara:strand:- start:225 stop:545 length:321 start_codon:yes stop_codon:yes gene_type:complete
MTLLYIATLLILSISVIINIFLFWFAFNLTRQIRFYDDELRGIVSIVRNFTAHLDAVHELETFYGDETLRNLLRHSSEIVKTFKSYDLTAEDEGIDDSKETAPQKN